MSSYSSFSPQSLCEEDFTVRRTVEDHGDFRIIANAIIPDISGLSEAERHALCDKLEELERESLITPPPDHAAAIARAREVEERSRKALQDAGCPPCYPPDLFVPFRNVPEKYEVISYWKSLLQVDHVVLAEQLSDWTDSCDFQKRNRRYYVPRGAFPKFVDRVRDRRRRHGLEGDVYLLPGPEQQSRLQNWIEFQNYHLHLHEDKERKTKDERDRVDTARKSLEISRETISFMEGGLKYVESQQEEHSKMLRWIEQQRKVMVAEQAASVQTAEDHDRSTNMPTPPSPSRRKRHQKSRSPLAPVRSAVSKKAPPKQRSLRPSKRDVPQSAENATAATKAPRRSKRIAELEDKPSRCDVESTPLRRPQSVARAEVAHARKGSQLVSTSTNVNRRWQLTARSKRRKEPEQPASGVTKRRSERERRRF
ncbi:MAG: hypothetical protein L6R35_006145 [Caloplaca aegaea]|nr:MAG: hypothetical protein L6R35_006145 [Caloplaca aegaea]